MAAKLSRAELQAIKDEFKKYDKNGDGWITQSELKEAMKQAGNNMSDEDIRSMTQAADINADGKLDYREFVNLMASQMIGPTQIEALFKQFDVNGDGFIKADELGAAMKFIGKPLSKEGVDEMLKVADKNNDSKISLAEFTAMMQ